MELCSDGQDRAWRVVERRSGGGSDVRGELWSCVVVVVARCLETVGPA